MSRPTETIDHQTNLIEYLQYQEGDLYQLPDGRIATITNKSLVLDTPLLIVTLILLALLGLLQRRSR